MTQPIPRDAIYRRRVFDAELIEVCVGWYISYRLSYRDLVEMMAVETVEQGRSDLELHCFFRFEKIEEHTPPRRRDVARPVVIANPFLTLHFTPPDFRDRAEFTRRQVQITLTRPLSLLLKALKHVHLS